MSISYKPRVICTHIHIARDKWVPVTRTQWVLRLRMEERSPMWRVARQLTRGSTPAWGLGEVLTTPHLKNVPCYEMFTKKALVNAVMDLRVPYNAGNFLAT
jgi:hypothetical protein